MKKLVASIAVMVAFFMLCTLRTTAKDMKAGGRIGELLIVATGVQETTTSSGLSKPGFHSVRFTITVRNVGKHALCTLLKSRLESTLNVETHGFVRLGDRTGRSGAQRNQITQLLPGEELQGEILFSDIRDGVEPLILHIEQYDPNQGCSRERPVRASWPMLAIKVANVPKLDSSADHPQP